MLAAFLGAGAIMTIAALLLPPWAGGDVPEALHDEPMELIWLPVCVDPPPPGIPDPAVYEQLEPTWAFPTGRAGLVACTSLLNPRPLPPVTGQGARPLPEHPPVLIERVEPRYPSQALFSGLEGQIDVLVQIDAHGEVVEAAIARSEADRLLEDAALAASRQFRFRPAMQGNLPVAASMLIPFHFAVD